MKKGWILIHRQMVESDIWDDEEPFDRRSAWIDLLLMVNHQDKRIIFDGHPMIVRRGQTITSVRKLANRWHWSPNRTLRYLRLLEELGMIIKKSDNSKTLLTIVKYEFYQDMRYTDGDSGEYSDENSDGPQTKKEKNLKKYNTTSKFNSFQKTDYDFDEIERLLSR